MSEAQSAGLAALVYALVVLPAFHARREYLAAVALVAVALGAVVVPWVPAVWLVADIAIFGASLFTPKAVR